MIMKNILLITLIFASFIKTFAQITTIPKTEPDKITEKVETKIEEKAAEKVVEKPIDSIKILPKLGLLKITVTIENRNGDYIYIKIDKNKTKKMRINQAGFFSDTLSVNDGFYQLYDGKNFVDLYVKDGYDMIINADASSFAKSLAFSGDGAVENNFMATSRILENRVDFKNLMNMNYSEFKSELEKKRIADTKRLQNANFDDFFNVFQQKKIENFINNISDYYKKEHEIEKPVKITNIDYKYPDYNGKMTSIKDFLGGYVFIQVWSMKSGASEAEAPYLREIIRKYSSQGINFINICIDLENGNEVEIWKKYIDEHGLTGTQLLADSGWNSKIITDFNITSLPRYILVDPAGKLMQPNAPRPSSPNLRAGFEQLLNGDFEDDNK